MKSVRTEYEIIIIVCSVRRAFYYRMEADKELLKTLGVTKYLEGRTHTNVRSYGGHNVIPVTLPSIFFQQKT